jgi:hypothetical protein
MHLLLFIACDKIFPYVGSTLDCLAKKNACDSEGGAHEENEGACEQASRETDPGGSEEAGYENGTGEEKEEDKSPMSQAILKSSSKKVWHFAVGVNGREYSFDITAETEKEARDILRKDLGEIVEELM